MANVWTSFVIYEPIQLIQSNLLTAIPLHLKTMALLARAARPSVRSAIRGFKAHDFTSRAALSTISEAIKKDHQEIKDYANNIRTATDDDTKTRWQNQFTWELARHSIGEELVVYPAFAKHLGAKGQEMADRDRAEHQSVGLIYSPGQLCFKYGSTDERRSRKL